MYKEKEIQTKYDLNVDIQSDSPLVDRITVQAFEQGEEKQIGYLDAFISKFSIKEDQKPEDYWFELEGWLTAVNTDIGNQGLFIRKFDEEMTIDGKCSTLALHRSMFINECYVVEEERKKGVLKEMLDVIHALISDKYLNIVVNATASRLIGGTGHWKTEKIEDCIIEKKNRDLLERCGYKSVGEYLPYYIRPYFNESMIKEAQAHEKSEGGR